MQIEIDEYGFTFPEVPLPEVWTVEQLFDTPTLALSEVEAQTRVSVQALLSGNSLAKGSSVAVGVGSRGLDNQVLVVRTVIDELRNAGMNPFIVPAMGSHGGATDEGQIEVLHSYGITPENTGAEIRATMEVERIGTLEGETAGEFAGHPVWFDKNAYAADAVLLINRIKPHTDFTNDLESGIAKMCAIGLGKRKGAEGIHFYGARGLRDLIPRVSRFLADKLSILGGIALLENELGRTSEIHALQNDQIACEGEKALLRRAREMSPRLPFAEFDVLIVDELGKNISGAGMDTHVIGRGTMPSIPEQTWGGPDIRLIAVLDVTDESHGNITAVGLADLTTKKLIDKADFSKSLINMRTSGEGGILRARLPVIQPTGEDCVRTAIACCGAHDRDAVRLVRIRNTAHTRFLEITSGLLDLARSNPRLKVSETSRLIDLSRHP